MGEDRVERGIDRFVLSHMNEMAWIMAMDMTVTYVSPSVLHVLGHAPDELMKDGMVKAMTAESAEKVRKLMADSLDKDREGRLPPDFTLKIDTDMVHKDGSLRRMESVVGFLRNDQGKTEAIVGVSRDISNRLRLETELIKAHTLESIGTLAGGIAHDFNNLLMAIAGNLDMAKGYLSPLDKATRFVESAARMSLLGKDLTSKLITFSWGEPPKKERVDVGTLIDDACRIALTGSTVEFVADVPSDIPPVVVDRIQLEQVLYNLIMNAKEAMPRWGVIEIRAREVYNSGETLPLPEGAYLKISVKDQGIGIPPENLAKVFDPYFTTKSEGEKKGMGLGLTIAFSIIQQHGGHITAESAPKKGTTFSVYLPITAANGRACPAPSESAKSLGKVLFMDDEDPILILGRDCLEAWGYEVVLARNGREAVDAFSKAMEAGAAFDAVILDLTIRGGMGGGETMDALRALAPNVKAIICSGYPRDPVVADYRSFGFRAAIIKPYTIQDLKAALEKVLREG